VDVSNVSNEQIKQQVIALGRLGWSLRRNQKTTGMGNGGPMLATLSPAWVVGYFKVAHYPGVIPQQDRGALCLAMRHCARPSQMLQLHRVFIR